MGLNNFKSFALISQMMVSTSLLKSLKKLKCCFQTFTKFVFDFKKGCKPFSRILRMTNFRFKIFWRHSLAIADNVFNLLTQNVKNIIFKYSEHSFLTSMYLKNDFLKCFPWRTLHLNSFEGNALLSQKKDSTLSLRNLQKFEKCHFQALRTFVFDRKVA